MGGHEGLENLMGGSEKKTLPPPDSNILGPGTLVSRFWPFLDPPPPFPSMLTYFMNAPLREIIINIKHGFINMPA